MVELVQLETTHQKFAERNARIIASSIEGLEDARTTQQQFPHLIILSDEARKLTDAAQLIHKGAHPNGSDVDAPTTIIVDKNGVVKWIYRSDNVFRRLTPAELLAEVDRLRK